MLLVRLSGGAVLAASLAISVAAQNRDTVWTRVSAEGSDLLVRWHKDHPWDTQLTASGLGLFAEYRTATQGVVSERVGRAVPAGSRGYRFTLPDSLTGTPDGGVCLYLQRLGPGGDSRAAPLLPIRRATAGDGETARFAYEAWVARVKATAEARQADARIAEAERGLRATDERVRNRQAALAEDGWADPGLCESAPGGDEPPLVQPYDAVPPERHDEIARRVCIWRLRGSRDQYADFLKTLAAALARGPMSSDDVRKYLAALHGLALPLPAEIPGLLARGGSSGPGLAVRQKQARELERDWARFAASSPRYKPHLGGNDYLAWTSEAASAALRLFGPAVAAKLRVPRALAGLPAPTPQDRLGVAGAALDAYGGCLDDARKQLVIKWDNWRSLEEAEPERRRQRRAFLSAECRRAHEELARLRDERDRLAAVLDAARRHAESPAPPALTRRVESLNFFSCRL